MRAVRGRLSWAGAPEPAFASLGAVESPVMREPRVLLRGERSRRGAGLARFIGPAPRGLGIALSVALILTAGAIGAVRGGQYQAFVAAQGSLSDFLARQVGLGVKVVTMNGLNRLGEREVLSIAGISTNNSVPFFDVDAARAKLEKTPLVASASVRKLYPGRIFIDVVERSPAAIWQRDGNVSIVAADGAALDELRDARLNDLPFVVGAKANTRLKEYLSLLEAAEELKSKIEAGVFVGERRWNLRMKTGVDVKLPENDPVRAMRALVDLERGSRILERDILSLDLREPGRAFVKLSSDAADARAEKLAAMKPKKGERP